MGAQSLVLCRDPDVLRTLCPLLFDMNMGVEICLGTRGASRILQKRKFDAVIVECDADGNGLDLLEQIRSESPNQHTITVGIVDDPQQMKAAFATGANFVLSKPISQEDAGRILRFTKGIITRMVRRFLRVAVHHLAHVDIEGRTDPAFILDLSEGGMAMQSLAPVNMGQKVAISFQLPGVESWVEAEAKVVWTDPTGRAGLEFSQIAEEDRENLKGWVGKRLRESPEEIQGVSAETPASVRVLSQWMYPLARVIDSGFVALAAILFCLIAVMCVHKDAHAVFPRIFAFFLALLTGSAVYSSLFILLDVRFPGTLAVQSLLTAAARRDPATPLEETGI